MLALDSILWYHIRVVSYDSVAQLDRAFDYESKGREFESLLGHHFTHIIENLHDSVAQLDRAFDYESKGREFESLLGHHY